LLALQNELVTAAQGQLDRNHVLINPVPAGPNKTSTPLRQPLQLALRSAAFIASPIQNSARAAGSLGRGVLLAGDRLKDLIVPDALAAMISTPAWMPNMPNMGIVGGGIRNDGNKDGGLKAEKLRAELDNMLASNCPLCESVVVGLDKPFVKDGEVDTSWAL
jgi:vacuolar protein sorting-associated protein 18